MTATYTDSQIEQIAETANCHISIIPRVLSMPAASAVSLAEMADVSESCIEAIRSAAVDTTIRACQERSNLCWQQAIDTCDAGTEADWTADAEECDGFYGEAIDLIASDPLRARVALQCAQELERRGGDDQHARAALAAIEAVR